MKAKILLAGAAASALMAGLSLATATEAHASVQICNKSHKDVFVAVAYTGEQNEGIVTEGWWDLSVGDCATVYGGSVRNKWVGYYARSNDRTQTWSGEHSLCSLPSDTSQPAFRFLNAQVVSDCSSQLGFREMSDGGNDDAGVDLTP
jgi:uncharacterized membrane protein